MKKNINPECIGRLEALERLLEREVESVRDNQMKKPKKEEPKKLFPKTITMCGETLTTSSIIDTWTSEVNYRDERGSMFVNVIKYSYGDDYRVALTIDCGLTLKLEALREEPDIKVEADTIHTDLAEACTFVEQRVAEKLYTFSRLLNWAKSSKDDK